METRDELLTTLYLQMSRCLSVPDYTSLHHCFKSKQLKLNAFSSKDPANGVFNIMFTQEVYLVLCTVTSRLLVFIVNQVPD